ncbi:MAG: transcriptional regulator NrdR [Candidatus Gracilibacteria bacterium]|nr:transcriptional regulator NrdR [Candidatus Gracilibacteria bacterium]
MYCPVCGNTETKVLDSRVTEDGKSIKRRRECLNCGNRFNTFEKYEKISLIVEKNLGKMEEYNEEKLYGSILKAFNKRNISIKIIDNVMFQIEQKLLNKRKITSRDIGAYVLEELKKVDEVAYIRYASVYHNFQNAQDYVDFIKKN